MEYRMKIMINKNAWFASIVVAAFFAVTVFTGCTISPNDQEPVSAVKTTQNTSAAIDHAIEVQNRNTDALMEVPNVIGTGVGYNDEGRAVIYLFTGDGYGSQGYPSFVEGIPTYVKYVGTVRAFGYTGQYRNPFWSGVSIGNDKECAAGTLGCVVTKGGKNYILSNNHVLARENNAKANELINQPGRLEVNCGASQAVAKLSQFINIDMKPKANNTVDAAIAEITVPGGITSTMADNLYTPSANPVAATVNMPVQKVGRTTGRTQGIVSAVNVTVTVQYSRGQARFIQQIYITPRTFSAAGDSGSLICENNGSSNPNPVGLLFAGSNSGTFANMIQNVLGSLAVQIVPQ
jgi:hypothetical protein